MYSQYCNVIITFIKNYSSIPYNVSSSINRKRRKYNNMFIKEVIIKTLFSAVLFLLANRSVLVYTLREGRTALNCKTVNLNTLTTKAMTPHFSLRK